MLKKKKWKVSIILTSVLIFSEKSISICIVSHQVSSCLKHLVEVTIIKLKALFELQQNEPISGLHLLHKLIMAYIISTKKCAINNDVQHLEWFNNTWIFAWMLQMTFVMKSFIHFVQTFVQKCYTFCKYCTSVVTNKRWSKFMISSHKKLCVGKVTNIYLSVLF